MRVGASALLDLQQFELLLQQEILHLQILLLYLRLQVCAREILLRLQLRLLRIELILHLLLERLIHDDAIDQRTRIG